MLNDIRERLTRARVQLRRKKKLDSMLVEAHIQLNRLQNSRSQSEHILDREKADVDKIEGFSLAALFYSILGTKEERLKTERQEHLAAMMKYEECTLAIEDAQREIDNLSAELAARRDAESEYKRLMEEKRQLLAQAGG